MNCNYKVNIKDIQNKYKFNIFAMGGYNDSDLRKMIESVYYALPRVNGSGTNVTLTDTAFSYMKNKLYATDTSQNTTTGKNLLPTLNATQSYKQTTISVENGIFHDTTSRTGTTEYACTFTFTNNINYGNYGGYTQPTGNIIELEAGTYTFSYKKISGNAPTYDDGSKARSLSVYQYKDTQPYTLIGSTRILGDTASFTFTLTEKTKITLCYGYYFYTDISSNVYFTLQLESGSSASEWEEYTGGIASPNPDYPQVIHTITGDNEVVVCGKNLLPFTNQDFTLNSVRYYSQNGKLYLNGTSSSETNRTNTNFKDNFSFYLNAGTYILKQNKLDSGGAYYFVKYLSKYSDDTSLGFVNNSKTTDTITLTERTQVYLGFYVYQKTFSNETFDLQLEKSATPTTYEPHKNNSVLLTLGDKEICKIGDYEDKIFKAIKGNEIYDSLASEEKATLDYGKWYLRKNIIKKVLNGSENSWGMDTTKDITQVFTLVNGALDKLTSNNSFYSNYFINQAGDTEKISLTSATKNLYLALNKTRASSVNELKNWLSTHNTIVYYVLETPVNELFNDTIQDQLEDIYNNMLSYEGQTNVSQVNEDLPFNINSTALKDLNNL